MGRRTDAAPPGGSSTPRTDGRSGSRHRSGKEADAINLLKLREGGIAHGLPVDPTLVRIRFDEAADEFKTESAVNGRRLADELERQLAKHLLPYFTGRRTASTTTPGVRA
jgi:hypothetical protein